MSYADVKFLSNAAMSSLLCALLFLLFTFFQNFLIPADTATWRLD